MFPFSSPVDKAAFDLASIGLVWAGTLAITFGGIPALVTVFLAADGAQLLGVDGAGSVKNLGRYAASWRVGWPNRPSSTAALT